jgi:hypothetical protein
MSLSNKELLNEISIRLKNNEITNSEILDAINYTNNSDNKTVNINTKKVPNFSVSRLLNIIGAFVVSIGIVIFIGQIWPDLGSFGKIFVTLGLGMLFSGLGSMLLIQKPENIIGGVFHFIGGVLIPSGALVTLNELGGDNTSLWPVVITFLMIFLFYLSINYVHNHPILTFFSILNGTAMTYLFVAALNEYNPVFFESTVIYLTMIVGSVYLLLSNFFQNSPNIKLIKPLNFFGSLFFLLSAFSQIYSSIVWQIIYLFLLVGCFYLSIYMKSREILLVSTLFLLSYVSFITGTYFATSLGWPVSLVILGFMFIALGYISISINKRYINTTI